MVRVAVRSEDGDLVSAILQANCRVNDEALRSANAQVWVEEDNVLLSLHVLVQRCFGGREW